MSNELAKIVIDTILFLELSDDEAIDPDVAVRQLETITSRLCQMSAVEKKAFLEVLSSEVKDMESRQRPESEIEAAQLIADHLMDDE